MWRVVAGRGRALMEKHKALITNSLVFGGLSGGAELSQQVLLRRVFPREEERRPLDWAAVGRYLVVGLIISPALTTWYRWLDRRLPGTSPAIIAKKVVVDALVLDVPYYSAFYMIMNWLESKPTNTAWAEVKAKLPTTILYARLLWIPGQAINFRYIAPANRVVFIAMVSFLEFNILAFMKRIPVKEVKTDSNNSTVGSKHLKIEHVTPKACSVISEPNI